MYHRLKLYEEEGATQTTKKPVVTELYDEVVFSEPVKAFYDRVVGVRPGRLAGCSRGWRHRGTPWETLNVSGGGHRERVDVGVRKAVFVCGDATAFFKHVQWPAGD